MKKFVSELVSVVIVALLLREVLPTHADVVGAWIPLAVGAGVGLLGGLFGGSKKPPKYDKYMVPGLFNPEQRSGNAADLTGYYRNMLQGNQPLMSPEEMRAHLGPQRAQTAADAASARKRTNERGISMGHGPRSGMVEETMGEIDRAELGANRQSYANLLGNLALMRPQLQMQAAGGLGNLTMADLQGSRQEQYNAYQAAAARKAAPSRWESAIGGALSGAGMGSMFGGGGGGGGQAAPYYISNSPGPGSDPFGIPRLPQTGYQFADFLRGW
jgi:hypothetical protein